MTKLTKLAYFTLAATCAVILFHAGTYFAHEIPSELGNWLGVLCGIGMVVAVYVAIGSILYDGTLILTDDMRVDED